MFDCTLDKMKSIVVDQHRLFDSHGNTHEPVHYLGNVEIVVAEVVVGENGPVEEDGDDEDYVGDELCFDDDSL